MTADFSQTLTALLRAGLCSEKGKALTESELDDILLLANRHSTAYLFYCCAVACATDKALPQMKKLFAAATREMLHHECQMSEITRLCSAFEDIGADYIPLKGCILKKMYPDEKMRAMGDADILIKTSQLEKILPVMESLGFELYLESNHEYIFKKGTVVVELHKMLIPSYNDDFYEYFKDGWGRAIKKDESSHAYCLSENDGFIYLFTHFAKHYRDGGIGIKHLTDIYVYLQSCKELDMDYVQAEFKKTGLYEFYKNVTDTLEVWFNQKESTPITSHITEVIISSGAFGTHKAHVYAQALRASLESENATRSMFFKKAFPSLTVMKIKYKFLEKAPVLLPFAWIMRITDALFHKRKNIKMHTRDIMNVTGDDIADYKKALQYVGLDFEKTERHKK